MWQTSCNISRICQQYLADCHGAIKATLSRVAESPALDLRSLIACYGVVNHQAKFGSAILPFVVSFEF